jgi:hypothetical protein
VGGLTPLLRAWVAAAGCARRDANVDGHVRRMPADGRSVAGKPTERSLSYTNSLLPWRERPPSHNPAPIHQPALSRLRRRFWGVSEVEKRPCRTPPGDREQWESVSRSIRRPSTSGEILMSSWEGPAEIPLRFHHLTWAAAAGGGGGGVVGHSQRQARAHDSYGRGLTPWRDNPSAFRARMRRQPSAAELRRRRQRLQVCAGAGGENGIAHHQSWLRFPYAFILYGCGGGEWDCPSSELTESFVIAGVEGGRLTVESCY